MDKNTDRTWAEVNLDNIVHNYEQFKSLTGTNVMCVVKADGYGHGAVETALRLQERGCGFFGVAAPDEAVELCRAGITVPVLIMNYTHVSRYEEVLKFPNIRVSVFNLDELRSLSKTAAERGAAVKIHLKLDTGMTRMGFNTGDAPAAFELIHKLPGLELEGLFTHFACADETDPSYTEWQFERYMKTAALAGDIPIKHVCNSAGAIMFPHMRLDMVRIGISLYGCYPSEAADKSRIALKPAMSLKTRVGRLNEVEPGVCVSYGRTFTTARKSRLATIPAGYGDGVSRLMRDIKVLVNGREAPIVGRVCMDQCVVDVTDVGEVNLYDEVEIYGENIPVEHAAAVMGTINYEILCMVGRRVPRVYYAHGEVVESRNTLVN
ncbi:MAG: alanine racemase [Defluviitaleaceae bacterium]|nr:alanine racemase [Defluviitaleaceae bacterium]